MSRLCSPFQMKLSFLQETQPSLSPEHRVLMKRPPQVQLLHRQDPLRGSPHPPSRRVNLTQVAAATQVRQAQPSSRQAVLRGSQLKRSWPFVKGAASSGQRALQWQACLGPYSYWQPLPGVIRYGSLDGCICPVPLFPPVSCLSWCNLLSCEEAFTVS